MNKALRKAIIAGNWKMNKNRKEAAELINALKPIAADKTCGVIICVPFTNLETALSLTEGTNMQRTYISKRVVHSPAKFPLIC